MTSGSLLRYLARSGGWRSIGGVRWNASGMFAEEIVSGGKAAEIRVSDRCLNRLNEISAARDGMDVALRIAVEGGGCSGFQYNFELEEFEGIKENERVFERNGRKVIVDDVSLSFLAGSEVDFEEEMIRTSFKIVDNPNSESSCSCGSSFAAK